MSEHMGAIALILAGLVVFALFIVFGTDVVDPLMGKIGTYFNETVDGIFAGLAGKI